MTEWTFDLMVPTGEVDDTDDMAATQDAARGAPAPPDSSPYRDLVAGALIEDIQLDLVEWFP
jgi:hypothetical protein